MSAEEKFKLPEKNILLPKDLPLWLKSRAYLDYIKFIESLNKSVEGKNNFVENPASDNVQSIIKILNNIDSIIDETPPLEQPQRFGNKAFKIFYDKISKQLDVFLNNSLPNQYHLSIIELKPYLNESFGNEIRIDYGTGHEMNFVIFLLCLQKIGFLSYQDNISMVLELFNKYLLIIRKLQTKYKMEPAGSHGVWSLDDYQFLPFLWGSSQLIGNNKILPSTFPDPTLAEDYGDEYLFMGAIKFIHQVKTGPFSEHSYKLWNISGVQSWQKINLGLIRMYNAEVLNKFPVVQHLRFGSLFSIEPFIP